MTETKRDLRADLELCEKATPGPWVFVDSSGAIYRTTTVVEEDIEFIAEAHEGWPHAIRRAIAAEARVAELEAEVERLRRELAEHEQLIKWALQQIYGTSR